MKSTEIRERFLSFFAEREHRRVPSSSLVPNDPTLLLTAAGMVQFKPYFLGEEQPSYTRATTVQKCLRTTDIESVGMTARHCTFFEMLGNFSFGDYYKEEVIPWAWEFLTTELGVDPASLWISVYEDDDEAEEIWKSVPGVRHERIVRLGAEDNFWDMGETGPCGPCSEILYDRGEQYSCGEDCSAGCDCDRFLELWNLVFMQYERQEDDSLIPLPRKNIDTGMGLERIASLKQGAPTIFETDLVRPIIDRIERLSGVALGENEKLDVSLKVIADHVRAATFLISDGVIPSNEARGYILRRLLRRAVRHGKLLGIEGEFLAELSDHVVGLLGEVYPELVERQRLVTGVIRSEEERFGQTLEQGIVHLGEVIRKSRDSGEHLLDGKTVFFMHDTLGFPLELTEEIAAESGMGIDRETFEELMSEQRERARASREEAVDEGLMLYAAAAKEIGPSGFEGYECAVLPETPVAALFREGKSILEAADAGEIEVVLERTPFYAESGGQVGDTGILKLENGSVAVTDTYFGAPGFIVHKGALTGSIKVGEKANALVDMARRKAISRNHSATHVLHWALRQVLGTHASQSGSLVTPDRLRFDFTHYQPVTEEELEEIERIANAKVLANEPVGTESTSREEAVAAGAIALFGERYSERVRVVGIGDFSKELCGGIHVGRTGEIGTIHILSESGIGSGLRRIEAISGLGAIEYFKRREHLLGELGSLLKVNAEMLPHKVEELIAKTRELERAAARGRGIDAASVSDDIRSNGKITRIELAGGFNLLTHNVRGTNPGALRNLADSLMNEGDYGAIALACAADGKAQLVVKLSSALVEAGADAREIARIAGEKLGGGGGGRPDMAVSGGANTSNVDAALGVVAEGIAISLGEAP